MIKKIILIVFVALGLSLLIFLFNEKGISSLLVAGNSMVPTYIQGDKIFCISFRNVKELNRNDIVIFNHIKKINNVVQETDIIKRIIGLPGDTISIDNGKVYVNGNLLNETYIQGFTNLWEGGFTINGEEKKIPADSFYVMGDNRPHSSDSREFGFINIKDIKCFLPYKKFVQ